METTKAPYTYHTFEIIDEIWHTTDLDLKVDYWNLQHHVLIGKRHVFCGTECECRAFMEGMLQMVKLNKA